jgi:serine/threonine protein kinase
MKPLTDSAVTRLQADMQLPDLSGTRYRIIRYLARGGMGTVWLVEDTVLMRRVALKVLDLVTPAEDVAERLLQEARILASLEHPGIVPVHDAGTLADSRAFYCMKFVEGHTLAEHVADKSLPERLRLLERVAEPLDFAHVRGFIHRDLKPENIMIGAFGEVLIMDWGLAKIGARSPDAGIPNRLGSTQATSRDTVQGSILGTPGYMSPEQARAGSKVDHRTDIFSLGAILWFMLGGSAPDKDSRVNLPRPLRAICAKAMAADPNARYPSAGALNADVASYLRSAPVSAYRERWFERTGRIYARHRVAVGLVAAYLMMRGFFILWARR